MTQETYSTDSTSCRSPQLAQRQAVIDEAQTMDLSENIWNRLPVELIREVLLILAGMSISKARQLRFVSSDVNVLVLPVLFRHVHMGLPDHVFHFTATLLPKRKNYGIPGLKSKLHIMPRLLSSYTVNTWVFVVNERRPSIETALSNVAPVFTGVSNLVITGQNLSSNAFWLRQHAIHPTTMFLVHFGSPHLVNFYDPIFKFVTHLYTSITHGHRYSTVADLPCLTHLAVSTRADLQVTTARNVAESLASILKLCENLKSFVLLITFPSTEFNLWQYQTWKGLLARCLEDRRFVCSGDFRPPRMEWEDIVSGGPTLWDRALEWQKCDVPPTHSSLVKLAQIVSNSKELRQAFKPGGHRKEENWEIDLVQRDSYKPHADDPDLQGAPGFMSAFD